jgi:hypothetical protein
MTVNEWLASAVEDAQRRGLDGLKPLLESLARSTTNLRRAADERLPAAGRVDDRARH